MRNLRDDEHPINHTEEVQYNFGNGLNQYEQLRNPTMNRCYPPYQNIQNPDCRDYIPLAKINSTYMMNHMNKNNGNNGEQIYVQGKYCDNVDRNRNSQSYSQNYRTQTMNSLSFSSTTDSFEDSYTTENGASNGLTFSTLTSPIGNDTTTEECRVYSSEDKNNKWYNSETASYFSSISSERSDSEYGSTVNESITSKLRALIFRNGNNDIIGSNIFTINLQNESLDDVSGLKNIVPNVINCNISSNNITSLIDLPKNTTICDCSHNNISSKGCKLAELTHLEHLNISDNNIGPDLTLLKECLHLRSVNLSHNNITSLDGICSSWLPLIELDLSHNDISGIIDFKDFVLDDSIQNLNESLNSNAHSLHYKGWFTIEILNLSYNKITEIRNISLLPSLKEINLNGNPIKSLIETSKHKSSIKRLLLRDTSYKLKAVIGVNGHELLFPFLKSLEIDGFRDMNKWPSIPETVSSLEILDCFQEHLPKWSIFPTTLKILKLERINNLKHLPTNFSTLLPNLEELYLPNNNLVSCHNILSTVPTNKLFLIDLRGNPIAIKYEIENQDPNNENISEIRRMHDIEKCHKIKPNLFNLLCLGFPRLRTILLRNKSPK
ncbi:similar to Saccharomyces cerevisiae YOR373W NUD1 Component of the spindle pole body outer plaque, required for exit from mitosis [Maudiozyma saulgeensis]|uniref:Similar to Saccharomyces cerevisiae YOR373W NUD1 Component of the spindle pole body outer plaque, required for exit from mitosis n=1 Tax=Maudiozyma saulgeensis TaxID=1789683 RepID=A0A1X7QZT3_9SACH|nr:similar to Saccharomyces cerevisiae YOR373W NUD1 Component of the spindle pole body outer plaque, required for exit from mitosis [Kazachstania saulgeensis]